MKLPNYKEKIELYLKANPNLSHSKLGVLLSIENLYSEQPKGIQEFRALYAHLDPNVIDSDTEGITFLKLVKSRESPSVIKEKLNDYINIKYNYIGDFKNYKENMERFAKHSKIVSGLIEDLLEIVRFPEGVVEVLKESKEVRDCHDFYELLKLYRNTKNDRIKFEILRRIGLIVLIARINRRVLIRDIDTAINEVRNVFYTGLGLRKSSKRTYYLWVDEHDKVKYCDDQKKAINLYGADMEKRNEYALQIYPLQEFTCDTYTSKFGCDICYFEIRDKLKKDDGISYTSFVEKIVRKNLEFPNQVHDLIGVKIVIPNEDEIPEHIHHLETFLGGSSTRKQEKNTLHKFGKKRLGRWSSKDYFVWKAIYDIPLQHPSIYKVQRMMVLVDKSNKVAMKELKSMHKYFKDRPQDYVVEVQMQDINSYLLSIAQGSSSDHDVLKMNQIRSNSFFKFFPKEIYMKELSDLRKSILKNGT
ncbi:MAG: hypothetical protein L6408_03310 [Nanoarchaeota archaeon]|nr:hypothetical protein [Nanoarchaeota archaeon]